MSIQLVYVFYFFVGLCPTPRSRALPLTIPVKGVPPLTIPLLIILVVVKK
jgi:hypothetical protein